MSSERLPGGVGVCVIEIAYRMVPPDFIGSVGYIRAFDSDLRAFIVNCNKWRFS